MKQRGTAGMAARLVNLQADPREAAVVATTAEAAALRARVREALADQPVSEQAVESAVEDLASLARGVRAIKGAMLDAGRALLRLQTTVGPGGYRALLRAGLVPYSEDQASRLRTVARAVDEGVLPAEALPRALSAAYAAARLPAPDAERLLQAGVLRPEASVREIEGAIAVRTRGPLSEAERHRLRRRLAWLEAEVVKIRARLAEDRSGPE